MAPTWIAQSAWIAEVFLCSTNIIYGSSPAYNAIKYDLNIQTDDELDQDFIATMTSMVNVIRGSTDTAG